MCHRDDRLEGSVFIKQWPSKIEITSPGGFPTGITPENIIFQQRPRDRRLAEAFGKCGLVGRAGQGAGLMFETAAREGKQPLDYRGTDDYQVVLSWLATGCLRRPCGATRACWAFVPAGRQAAPGS